MYTSQLLWANRREVEPFYLKSPTLAGNSTFCWLIEKGQVRLNDEESEITAQQGQWIFPSCHTSYQVFEEHTRIVSVRFVLNYFGGKPVFLRQQHQLFDSSRFPDLEFAACRLSQVFNPWRRKDSLQISQRDAPLKDLFLIESAFNLWLAAYTDAMEQLGALKESPYLFDTRVEEALKYLENFPLNHKFNELELSRHIGISVNQLLLLFRKETGTSPFNYYDQRRQEFARNLLKNTTQPVKEISYDLGFGSTSHFSTWFSKKEGLSPRAFRKQSETAWPLI